MWEINCIGGGGWLHRSGWWGTGGGRQRGSSDVDGGRAERVRRDAPRAADDECRLCKHGTLPKLGTAFLDGSHVVEQTQVRLEFLL